MRIRRHSPGVIRRLYILACSASILPVAVLAGQGAGAVTSSATSLAAGFADTHLPHTSGDIVGLSGVNRDDVWAVGLTTPTASGQYLPLAYHEQSGIWTQTTPPAPGQAAALAAVTALASTDVWAVGDYRTSATDPGTNTPLIVHWDGTTWTQVLQPLTSGSLTSVAARNASDIWAVGVHSTFPSGGGAGTEASIALHWDGAQWTALPTLTNVTFSGVAIRPDGGIWAVGQLLDPANGSGHAQVCTWTGSGWQSMATPASSNLASNLSGVTTSADGQAWAVGKQWSSTPNGVAESSLITRWNGTTWTTVDGPPPPPTPGYAASDQYGLAGVSAISGNDVWAVGGYVAPTSGRPGGHVLLDHWDGTSWSTVIAPQPVDQPDPAPQSDLFAVAALPDGSVWVGGAAGSTDVALVEALAETSATAAGFGPHAATAPAGATVAWRFDAGHEVRDASGASLYDSGRRPAGGSFTYTPPGAGTYPVVDPTTGLTGTLGVGISLQPISTGGQYLRWGSQVLNSSSCRCYYDVEIQDPGLNIYIAYQLGTAQPGSTWKPPAGHGIYHLRARYRQAGHSTGWSTPIAVNG